MAVLSASDPFAGVQHLSRTTAVLAAQGADLPQPDQLCGPFAAHAALHGVGLASVPSLHDLALAAGTHVWPHDEPEARPPGVAARTDGWDGLPRAATPDAAGTDAASLAAGVERATSDAVAAVGASGPWTPSTVEALLTAVRDAPFTVGVVANLRTGPVSGGLWDVGHFVVLWGVDPAVGQVAVADSYAGLGEQGRYLASLDDLAAALPGRGVLLLVASERRSEATDLVASAGLEPGLWAT
ncbi:DUF6885 family protein [Solicola sp. PLA-1-18]|uniref:DUF6885 family protein n=1 Tax=Solicola sp. PLA-1-18 TaxID=3380532 RepID=UPI003B81F34A